MNVAVRSFNTLFLVGDIAEVSDLFKLINDNLVIDRLYRRYIRREDNEKTLTILTSKTKIMKSKILDTLTEKIALGVENSNYFKEYGYCPVRLCIHDIVLSWIEEQVPLEDYDNLEGDPLWMRPEYMIEKYG